MFYTANYNQITIINNLVILDIDMTLKENTPLLKETVPIDSNSRE